MEHPSVFLCMFKVTETDTVEVILLDVSQLEIGKCTHALTQSECNMDEWRGKNNLNWHLSPMKTVV